MVSSNLWKFKKKNFSPTCCLSTTSIPPVVSSFSFVHVNVAQEEPKRKRKSKGEARERPNFFAKPWKPEHVHLSFLGPEDTPCQTQSCAVGNYLLPTKKKSRYTFAFTVWELKVGSALHDSGLQSTKQKKETNPLVLIQQRPNLLFCPPCTNTGSARVFLGAGIVFWVYWN